ncbi:hypothetical protein PROVRUST_08483, partial [Providencia rustigianii DSM 4541]
KPVYVVSGRRCAKHNKAVGGAEHSQHLLGTAGDIKVKDVTPKPSLIIWSQNIRVNMV